MRTKLKCKLKTGSRFIGQIVLLRTYRKNNGNNHMVLIRNVKDLGQNNRIVTDHFWADSCKAILKFKLNDVIEFSGDIQKYNTAKKLDYKIFRLRKFKLLESL